jgi:subfamily B ATP-binding cassette protein MsbA
LKREVRFDGVSFRYGEDGLPALDNITLTIRRGTMLAVVGRSGAGKSTLLDLLLRFRQPRRGRILVDGTSLAEFDVASWRAHIGVVSQDPYIFDDTIRDNILYGRRAATDAEVAEAARLAHADGFIADLPLGYDTIVGGRGVRLSGGQRQRLALARALVRQPDILILDEATNALDSLTEQAFQEALAEFAVERTVIVVAHRFSTIERADHIVVLDRGRICEQASLAGLLEADGLFAQMHRHQGLGPAAA